MQRSFSALQPDNQRQIKEAGNNLFLLYEGQNPAVMAECGFLSNPDEAAALSDSDYQKKVAFVLMQAILEFYAQQWAYPYPSIQWNSIKKAGEAFG